MPPGVEVPYEALESALTGYIETEDRLWRSQWRQSSWWIRRVLGRRWSLGKSPDVQHRRDVLVEEITSYPCRYLCCSCSGIHSLSQQQPKPTGIVQIGESHGSEKVNTIGVEVFKVPTESPPRAGCTHPVESHPTRSVRECLVASIVAKEISPEQAVGALFLTAWVVKV